MADPLEDFARRDAEHEEWLRHRPVCSVCGEPICADRAIYYEDYWCCDDPDCQEQLWQCIKEDFLVSVED